jgi:hypothetical protein
LRQDYDGAIKEFKRSIGLAQNSTYAPAAVQNTGPTPAWHLTIPRGEQSLLDARAHGFEDNRLGIERIAVFNNDNWIYLHEQFCAQFLNLSS